ncbi:MAG: GHMP kinase [Reyranella sp.]|jgi:D-glycero-alpha-D-manno-heptose-7-phosphate kinase|uniref:GHMP family kinase ATP-binding protein n=1 Tax=Reyranella sp. TaxID=1929291 RepID=UPI0025EABBA3|nr:GHMP kinase [Reyranella sp.]MBR2819952.1 GHMP kinase [Reyranella sp.]
MARPNGHDILRTTVRARAPLRLGLAGGGTDLSPYCEDYGGAVLNCTIDKYAYAFVSGRDDSNVVFRAVDLGIEETFPLAAITDSRLALHAGVYRHFVKEFHQGVPFAATITTNVDAPAGSGLGSSSALVVALVDVLRAYLNVPLGPYDVAHLAFVIERIDLGFAGGKQDQYAAAFGGVNFIEFLAGDRVIVNPLRMPDTILNEIETSIVVCFSGQSRESATIIDNQTAGMKSGTPQTIDALHQLKADAIEMKRALLQGKINEMATILNRSWVSKKATASAVTNPHLDTLYEVGRAAGALGGKVSGAGGGGYMMFIVPPEERYRLVSALNQTGAQASPVKFTSLGCETWHAKREG